MDTQEKIEMLKDLYSKIDNKKKFREAVAEKFHIKPSSVRTNWFGNRFEVPEKYGVLDRVLEFTKEYVKNQPKEEEKEQPKEVA